MKICIELMLDNKQYDTVVRRARELTGLIKQDDNEDASRKIGAVRKDILKRSLEVNLQMIKNYKNCRPTVFFGDVSESNGILRYQRHRVFETLSDLDEV